MPSRKLIVLAVMLIAASLFVTQCAPAAAPTSAPAATSMPAPTTAPAATSAPAATQAPAPTSAPAAGKRVLRISYSWPNRIDPAVGNDYVGSTSLANLYDTLVFPNAKGGADPWVATSWDVSSDGLTFTFHLRNDVKFHDGTPLKASDVIYSYNRLKTIGQGFAYLVATKNVVSVKAPDDYTVVFTLAKPSAVFVGSLVRLYILNEALVRKNTKAQGPYAENGDYGTEWLQTHDAASGPYMVTEFPLEQYTLLSKYTGWWGKFATNAPDEFRLIGTTEAVTVRTMLQNKELDITDQWQSLEQYQAFEKMDGVKVAALNSLSSLYFLVNNKKPPTDDIHCRKAMSYALDYQAATATDWPGTQQMIAPVPANLAGVDKSIYHYAHDLDKAKAEAAQCKYNGQFDKYPVVMQWVSEVPDEEKLALLVQSNMAEIGMKVNVVKVPWLSLIENVSKLDTSPHITTVYISADLPEAGLMYQSKFSSSTIGTWMQNEWLQDKTLDGMIQDSLETLDQTQRYAKYSAIQKYLMDLAPTLMVLDQFYKHGYRTCIDWPATRGETSLLNGYQQWAAGISVNCQ